MTDIDTYRLANLTKKTKDLKLLYVEDNQEAREQMLKNLRNFFNNIDVAIDGKDGLKKFKSKYYDLIITDINMPHIDGLEMSREILKLVYDKHIVIVSAYNDTDYLQSCIDIGISNYLHKPVSFDKLINVLEKITDTITNKYKIKDLNNEIITLLNHAQDGFLSFGKDFLCKSGFSKECLNIFETDTIDKKDISLLLFPEDFRKREIFINGIKNVLDSDDIDQKDLFLSIMPNETTIHKKSISINYRLLPNDRFMLILKDITHEKELQKELKLKNKIRDMIVEIVSYKEDFIDLKEDFLNFLKTPPKDMGEIKSKLHTFKGNFAQKNMIYITDALHKAETLLAKDTKSIDAILLMLSSEFEKDKKLIKENLYEDFFNIKNKLFIDKKLLEEIELKIKLYEFSHDPQKDRREILYYLQKLKYKNLHEMLATYKRYIELFARKKEKLLCPLEIEMDRAILVPKNFKPFIKSLVHIFNNSVEHGIEDPETRAEKSKNEYGTIYCKVEKLNHLIMIEIGDDGKGLDRDAISKKAIEKGILKPKNLEKLSDEEIYKIIFEEDFSLKESVTKTAGRGIGLNAIKRELDKLNGYFHITSKKDKGIKFEFVIPMKDRQKSTKTHQESILESIIFEAINLIKEQLKIDKFKTENLDCNSLPDNITFTQISFQKGYEGRCILGFDTTLLEKIKPMFIPEGFSKEEEDEMMEDMKKELNNIIVGLSLANLPKDVGAIEISTPEYIKIADIKVLENIKLKQISTEFGNIVCIITHEKEYEKVN